jgi:alpha-D-ribose 1-methylphosphonate 5-triphosphate diphosphatase
MSRALCVTGGRVLLPSGVEAADLRLEDGVIAAIGGATRGLRLDATGLLVLPGIVDLHGDAFERSIQPRPGVPFPAPLALRETEALLLANGITTAFLGITRSWEPGLRGIETWRTLLDALATNAWVCDMRVHLRWEAYNLGALGTAMADIRAGRVHLLAFNDHTPAILRRLNNPATSIKYSERACLSPEAFHALAVPMTGRAGDVAAGLEAIGHEAREAGIPIASHDDAFRARGADICEFPMTEEIARAASAAGDWVVMGSPNVIRGKSHLGWVSAARLAEAGICSVLCSDYYYPAMLPAALALADGSLGLARAWALVSSAPAKAGRIADRGVIAEGKRADLILVEPAARKLVATLVRGRIAFLSAEGADRLG